MVQAVIKLAYKICTTWPTDAPIYYKQSTDKTKRLLGPCQMIDD